MVFNNAVVDERDLAGGVAVRMGVDLVGRPVRGPARVADADRAALIVPVDLGFQGGDPTLAADDVQAAILQDGETG